MVNKFNMDKEIDEIFEGEEEIDIRGNATKEDILIEVFDRFCALQDGFIVNDKVDPRSILIVVLKGEDDKLYDIEEHDITSMDSKEVLDIVKEKDMLGYIISIWTEKKDRKDNKLCEALIRSLFAPNVTREQIIEFPSRKISKFDERSNYNPFDLWNLKEAPTK